MSIEEFLGEAGTGEEIRVGQFCFNFGNLRKKLGALTNSRLLAKGISDIRTTKRTTGGVRKTGREVRKSILTHL